MPTAVPNKINFREDDMHLEDHFAGHKKTTTFNECTHLTPNQKLNVYVPLP